MTLNTLLRTICLLIISMGLAACGEDQSTTTETPEATETPSPNAETNTPNPASPVEDKAMPAPSNPMAANADLKRGSRQFLKCRSCHTLAEGEKHKTGPNLWGFMGAEVATRPDFKYSSALTELDQTWSVENLDLFLKRPSKFAPGTIMSFAGIPKEKDRTDLIAYLIQETSGTAAPDNN